MKAKYTGEAPCPIRIGNRRPEPGEVIDGPADLIDYLTARGDFESVGRSRRGRSAPDSAAEAATTGNEE